MKSDGSAQKKLTNINNLNYLPDFSPKGDYVAFQSCPEPSLIAYDIYIIRTNGSDSIRLTDGKNGYYSPKWSPNGKKIVFVRAVVPKRYYREMTRDEAKKMHLSEDIFTMDKDGTNLKNLTNNEINDTNPHWSKNGKTIYFMSERDGSPNVYAMNPDGMNVRKIADGKIVTDTSISPDETFFVYSKEASGKWGIYIYEIKSGKERLLIEN